MSAARWIVLAIIVLPTIAFGDRCFYVGGLWRCVPGCHVVNGWLHGAGVWVYWACDPLTKWTIFGIALAFFVVMTIVASSRQRRAFPTDPDLIEKDIARTLELTRKLEADAREADQHIAAMIAKARRENRHE